MRTTQKQTTAAAKKLNRKDNDRKKGTSRPAMPGSSQPANPLGILSPLASEACAEKQPARPNVDPLREPQDEFEDLDSDDPRFNLQAVPQTTRVLFADVLRKHPVSENYRILLMYGNIPFEQADAEEIHYVLTHKTETTKPIALILHCPGGGDLDASFLISELCREFSPDRFITVVPRKAQSAATLICCGADEIHLGSMSEFGLLHPQVGEIPAPALAVKNAVEAVLDLAGQDPQAADELAKHLGSSLKLMNLGDNERVAQSETLYTYAKHFLKSRKAGNGVAPETIASTLVYGYKDHDVIDMGEAESVFGPGIIIANSAEYNMANALYVVLSMIESAVAAIGAGMRFYGSPDWAPSFYVAKSKNIGQMPVNT